MNSIKSKKKERKRKKRKKILKDQLPGLVGNQYSTGNEWSNKSIKNEEMEPKGKVTPSCECDW